MPVRANARQAPARRPAATPVLSCLVLALLAAQPASAFEIETGNPDLRIRWDNTVKYSGAVRLDKQSPGLSRTVFGPTGVVGPNNINQDDGNNNFNRGLVSNRFDLLSELDGTYKNVGFRISAAAWYDSVYNRSTDNQSSTSNHLRPGRFPDETRDLMGRKAEVLDAFVFGQIPLGERAATVRAGRHTLLWGESLFFGANGIAGGMAPLDLIKLQSVPNSTFKENALPTGKVSLQLPLSDTLTLGAYVPYEWKKSRLMPVGAYLSSSDALGPGAERINAGPTGVFVRQPDQDARDSGQYGLQLRWNAEDIDTQFGLYAIRYHATGPSNNITTLTGVPPATRASTHRWVYHEGIEAYGLSFAKSIDEWGLAGEVSMRRNAPLSSSSQSVLPAIGVGVNYDNRDNPGYAVGETLHAQLSWIASLGPSVIAREASFVGEIAWNTRHKVTRNEQMLNPNADRSATAMRMVYSPTYRQALSGLDLSPYVGLGYTWGKSSAVGPAFGVDLGEWVASLNLIRYLGPEGPTLDNSNNTQFKQALKDRNFLSFSLSKTF
jgi:hypothetical protein